LAAVSLGLLLLVWLAPVLVAHSPLRNWVLASVAKDLDATVTAESASFGWFSPVVLEGLAIDNADGNPLARIGRLSLSRSVGNLLQDAQDLGEVTIEQAELTLVVRADGSNLEDALAPLLASDEPSTPPRGKVRVVDAGISLADRPTAQSWKVERLNGTVDLPGTSGKPLGLNVSGYLPTDGATGRFALGAGFPVRSANTDAASGGAASATQTAQVTFKSDSLPLEAIAPLLARFAPGTHVSGRLASDVHVVWAVDASPADWSAKGQVSVAGLSLAAPWLAGDTLRMDQVSLPCDLTCQANKLTIRQLSLDSDVGKLSLAGAAPWAELIDGQWLAVLMDDNYHVSGQLDLAQLAQRLPRVLRLRDQTQITGGRLQIDLQRQGPAGASQWQGQIVTSDLTAQNDGRPVSWQTPLTVRFAARETPQGPLVEQFQCQSDFLVAQAQGRMEDLQASASFDLGRLGEQLGQFVDLGQVRMAGSGQASLQIAGQANGPSGSNTTANLSAELNNVQVAVPGKRPWVESRLVASLQAAGVVLDNRPAQVSSATLRLNSQDEQLTVSLAEAVAPVTAASSWPLVIEFQGPLGRWAARLEPLVPLDGWQIDGAAQLSAVANYAPGQIQIQQANLRAAQLVVAGHDRRIMPTNLQLFFAGQWNAAAGGLQISQATISSNEVALTARNVTLTTHSTDGFTLTGDVQYRADLAQVDRWLQPVGRKPRARFRGSLNGQLAIERSGPTTTVRGDTVIENLELQRTLLRDKSPLLSGLLGRGPAAGAAAGSVPVHPTAGPGPLAEIRRDVDRGLDGLRRDLEKVEPRPVRPLVERVEDSVTGVLWSEPRVTLSIAGAFDHGNQSWRFDSIALQSNVLQANLSGTATLPLEACVVDLQGTAQYNPQALSQVLRDHIPKALVLEGGGSLGVAVRGPVGSLLAPTDEAGRPRSFPTQLAAAVEAAWGGATWYGVNVGNAKIRADLAEGLVRFQPIDLVVSQGRLTTQPTIRMAPAPALLSLPKGPLLSDVVMTREVCATGLKFIAPVVADAVNAEGRFSLELAGGQFPLEDMTQGATEGTLTISSLAVSPSPAMAEFLALARQAEAIFRGRAVGGLLAPRQQSLIRVQNQNVRFRMAKGRMYHERLEMLAGNVPISTSGSVGLQDDSLDLLLEVPVQDQWLGGAAASSPWRNRVVRIPIRGTLSQPQIDSRVLAQIATGMAAGAGQRLLGEGINKGLERLFGTPPNN